MAQALQYQAAWETKLAERLDKPQNWKEIADVVYTDTQITNLPYIGVSGEPAVTTAIFAAAADRSTLSNVITFTPVTESSDTLVIVSTDYEAVYIDYADQAQSQYSRFVDLGELLGKKIGERVQSLTDAQYTLGTGIGDDGSGNVTLSSTPLTVSFTNIDDIIRGVIQQIQAANGFDMYRQEGGFIEWRPADWTKLVAFMQAGQMKRLYQNTTNTIGLVKSPLIDLDTQKWATGGKQVSPYFNRYTVQPERLNMETPEKVMR